MHTKIIEKGLVLYNARERMGGGERERETVKEWGRGGWERGIALSY